jgi:hypothetical protein
MFSTSSKTKVLKKPLSIIIDHSNYKAYSIFLKTSLKRELVIITDYQARGGRSAVEF